ncbi:MAG: hypothetical protein ACJ72W_12165 [Actinoallomurus sp.]
MVCYTNTPGSHRAAEFSAPTGRIFGTDKLAAFPAGVTGATLMPGGWLQTWVPGVLTVLWVLAASVLLVREHLPALTVRAPHVMGPGPA